MLIEIILGLCISYFTLFVLSIVLKDNSIADIFWGLGFLQVAIHAYVLSGTRAASQVLFTSLVALWSLRLASYILSKKWLKKGEDPRYARWREQWSHFYLRSFFQVYLFQEILLFIIAMPILLIHSAPPPVGFITVAGLCIALFGLIYETIGDLQLRSFIKTKKEGQIMTKGLWKYSRHPNYFGESLFWLGASIVAMQVSLLAIGSWILITLLLRYVSGVPLAEERYADNQAFQTYKNKTPAMIPDFFQMKSFVPLSGLTVYTVILLLEKLQIIPDPASSLQGLGGLYGDWSFLLLFLVILVESIVYAGFYFPGQLFAVILVLLNDFSWFNLIILTLVSIVAVTISAAINYKLGSLRRAEKKDFRVRELLIAMLHINLLALYMFQLGASRSHKKVILYAGLLNIPYYLLLIAGTFLIRDQIAIITEDTYFLFILLCSWTFITVILDIRERKTKRSKHHIS